MTGWSAVAATTGLMLIALVGLKVRLYSRVRPATGMAKRRASGAERPGA